MKKLILFLTFLLSTSSFAVSTVECMLYVNGLENYMTIIKPFDDMAPFVMIDSPESEREPNRISHYLIGGEVDYKTDVESVLNISRIQFTSVDNGLFYDIDLYERTKIITIKEGSVDGPVVIKNKEVTCEFFQK